MNPAESAEYIAQNSKHVTVHEESIKKLAEMVLYYNYLI